jgi:alpha/beta superfamily hydrolase
MSQISMQMIASPTGRLEAIVDEPPDAARAIILCHPHPQYGGSMHDGVLDTVAAVARRHRFATIRFNFRGVGDSSGRYDNGVGEVDDLLSVVDWTRARPGPKPLWIGGYSFGANVAWRGLDRCGDVAGVVLVAPPVAMMDFSARPSRPPKLTIVAGDRDDFVNADDLARWAATAAPAARIVTLAGADHFFSAGYAALAAALDTAFAAD